jgi:hypothetical protein
MRVHSGIAYRMLGFPLDPSDQNRVTDTTICMDDLTSSVNRMELKFRFPDHYLSLNEGAQDQIFV